MYVSIQIENSNVSTTLNVYTHLLKEVPLEQTERLDMILGFAEQPGNPSESVRRVLEDYPKISKKGAAVNLQPLELVGSGGRI